MNIHGSALEHLIDLIVAHKTGVVGKLGASPVTPHEAANAKLLSASSNISGPREKQTRAKLIDRIIEDFWSDDTSKRRAHGKAMRLLKEFQYEETDNEIHQDRDRGTVDRRAFVAVIDEVYPAGPLVDKQEREIQVETLWRYAVDRTKAKTKNKITCMTVPQSQHARHGSDAYRLDYARFIGLLENGDKIEAHHGSTRMQTADMSQNSSSMRNLGPGCYYTDSTKGLAMTVPRSSRSLPAAVTFRPQMGPEPFILPLGKVCTEQALAYGIRSSAQTFTHAAFQPSVVHKATAPYLVQAQHRDR